MTYAHLELTEDELIALSNLCYHFVNQEFASHPWAKGVKSAYKKINALQLDTTSPVR